MHTWPCPTIFEGTQKESPPLFTLQKKNHRAESLDNIYIPFTNGGKHHLCTLCSSLEKLKQQLVWNYYKIKVCLCVCIIITNNYTINKKTFYKKNLYKVQPGVLLSYMYSMCDSFQHKIEKKMNTKNNENETL